jgi:rhodanese-related sulfurtransferase
MKTVDRETLKGWLGQPDLFLMDLRNAADWNRSIAKIDNAHRFDPERLSKMVRDIPKNKKLVLYCEDGKTNCPTMAQELEKMGFTNLYFLEGGFKVWRGKEYPVVPKEYMALPI